MLEAHQIILMNQHNNCGRKTIEYYTVTKKTTENQRLYSLCVNTIPVTGANKVRNEYYRKRFQYIV